MECICVLKEAWPSDRLCYMNLKTHNIMDIAHGKESSLYPNEWLSECDIFQGDQRKHKAYLGQHEKHCNSCINLVFWKLATLQQFSMISRHCRRIYTRFYSLEVFIPLQVRKLITFFFTLLIWRCTHVIRNLFKLKCQNPCSFNPLPACRKPCTTLFFGLQDNEHIELHPFLCTPRFFFLLHCEYIFIIIFLTIFER